MALKNWERYVNKPDDVRFNSIVNRGSNWEVILIDGFKPEKYGWTVLIKTSDSYTIDKKEFKTKSEALKFANDYMKEHGD
jgi:hypothetical protein